MPSLRGAKRRGNPEKVFKFPGLPRLLQKTQKARNDDHRGLKNLKLKRDQYIQTSGVLALCLRFWKNRLLG